MDLPTQKVSPFHNIKVGLGREGRGKEGEEGKRKEGMMMMSTSREEEPSRERV